MTHANRRDFIAGLARGAAVSGFAVLSGKAMAATDDFGRDPAPAPVHHGINDRSAFKGIKAVLFDTFGTVVDWRGSLIVQAGSIGARRGVEADWAGFVDDWLETYRPAIDEVRSGRRKWENLDDIQRESLAKLLAGHKIAGLTRDDLVALGDAWSRLSPWPDSIPCLGRLRTRYVIGPLSNGNTSLLVAMAKHVSLPWDVVLGADVWRHYKPDPEAYLSICRFLDLQPGQVMLAAAHNADLHGAARAGLCTGFIPRPTEFGPGQKKDLRAEQAWTVVGRDFSDFASMMTA